MKTSSTPYSKNSLKQFRLALLLLFCFVSFVYSASGQKLKNRTRAKICAAASATVINNVRCFGGNDGSAIATMSGGITPLTYLWSNTQTTQTATGLQAGTYTVVVTDNIGVTSTATVSIVQPSALIANLFSSQPVSCFGHNNGSAVISAGGGIPNYTYNWLPINTSGVSANNLTAGTYTCMVTDANNCTIATTVIITQPPAMQITINANPTTCGLNNGSANSIVSGGTPGYNYSWSTTSSFNTNAINNLSPGSYSLTVTDASGCTTSNTVNINPSSAAVASFTESVLEGCAPLNVSFSNTSNNVTSSAWNFGDNNLSGSINGQHSYTVAGNYSVSLTITDGNGCTATITKNNLISVHQQPTANFSANPKTATTLSPIIYFTDKSAGATGWAWAFGDGNNSASAEQHPEFAFENAGCYSVTLTVTNEFGCVDSTDQEICIQPDYALYTPNSFTPDDDNINDIFLPKGTGADPNHFELIIFNRWGNEIYKTNDINKGWDSRTNSGNEIAQMDTYLWMIKIRDVMGEGYSYTGHVNLLK